MMKEIENLADNRKDRERLAKALRNLRHYKDEYAHVSLDTELARKTAEKLIGY